MAEMLVKVLGDKQLIKNLQMLPERMKKRVMKPAMRKGFYEWTITI